MPQSASPSVDFSADSDLISFFKTVPDGRYRGGVRFTQWNLLLTRSGGVRLAAGFC